MILWHVILNGKIEIKGTRTFTRHNSIYPITHHLHEERKERRSKMKKQDCCCCCCCPVTPVVSDSLQPHGLQHARLPCPSLSRGACSNLCPLSLWWWCHLSISSSVIPFSSCLQFLPASGSFLLSWLFSRATHQVAKVLEVQLQHQSVQWIFRVDFF